MLCAEVHGWVSLISGKPLRKVLRSMVESSLSMKEYNTASSLRATRFHQQAVGSLLGDPAHIHGTDGCHDVEEKSLLFDGQANFDEMVVSVFLENHELAWKLAEKLHNFGKIFEGSIWPYICSFYRGMSAFGKF